MSTFLLYPIESSWIISLIFSKNYFFFDCTFLFYFIFFTFVSFKNISIFFSFKKFLSLHSWDNFSFSRVCGDKVQKHVYTNQRKIKHWILLWFLWNIIPLIFRFAHTHSLCINVFGFIVFVLWSKKINYMKKYFFMILLFFFSLKSSLVSHPRRTTGETSVESNLHRSFSSHTFTLSAHTSALKS